MAFSNYISSATASGSGGITHSISNPGNNSFAWLNSDHMEFRLSTPGQSLSSFNTELTAETINKATNYTLIGTTLTFSGLTNGGAYHFEVKRVTPHLTHYVDFQAGSPITESDLDNSNRYALYRTQELEDGLQSALDLGYVLTLGEMKSIAGITGEFTGDTDTQTITNKTFTAGAGITSSFDLGTASWQ